MMRKNLDILWTCPLGRKAWGWAQMGAYSYSFWNDSLGKIDLKFDRTNPYL